MNLKPFKIRASAVGQIMTQPKSKADKEAGLLGETAKTYCENWVKQQIYGKEKEIWSKEMEKGNLVEFESIRFFAENSDFGMLMKNEQYFENEFFTGTPDVITSEYVIDMKNSWDCFSFPLFETEIPNKDYEYQLHVYMALTGRKKAILCYTLMNTPEELLHSDSNIENHTYDDIPVQYRIVKYLINFDQSIIDQIIEQVGKCQNYINLITQFI